MVRAVRWEKGRRTQAWEARPEKGPCQAQAEHRTAIWESMFNTTAEERRHCSVGTGLEQVGHALRDWRWATMQGLQNTWPHGVSMGASTTSIPR